MLPPLRPAADLNAPVHADATASGGLPAAAGEFGAALAALFGRSAAAVPSPTGLPRTPADGQSLPPGGKALPLPEPGAAPTRGVEGMNPAVQPVIEPGRDLTDAADLETAEMPLLPATLALPVPPAVADAAPRTAVGSDRPASLTLPARPIPEGVVPPTGERGPQPFCPEGPQTVLPLPVTPATSPAPLLFADAVAAATVSPAAAGFLGERQESKATPGPATMPSALVTLAALAPTATAPSAGFTAAIADIVQPPASAGFGDALGERVVWMAGHKIQNAEIRLHPAELGPVRVQISIDDGTASVHFHAHHALTRDAIEQAMPRLREMLVEQGITPGNTTVSEHAASRHPQDPGGRPAGATAPALPNAEAAIEVEDTFLPAARTVAPAGLIDLFA